MKKSYLFFAFFSALTFLLASTQAWAQIGAEDVAKNVVASTVNLPGLVSALMYLVGIILVITGLIKIKEYIDNERQTSLRTPVIRLLVAGMCFALPTIITWAMNTFNKGDTSSFAGGTDPLTAMTGPAGALFALMSVGTNFNALLENIRIFSDDIPGIVGALAYLLGVIITAAGILKLKEHIEEPEKISLKEPVTRLLTAGALFALPTIFKVVYTTLAGTGMGAWGGFVAAWNTWNFASAAYQTGINTDCLTAVLGLGSTVGDVICMSMLNSISIIGFLKGLSYVLGLGLGLWGVMKIRDHVLSPTQTKLSEGVMRLLAAGAFFALPYIATALQSTFMPVTLAALSVDGTTGYSGTLTCAGLLGAFAGAKSLDQAFGCFVDDLLAPSQTVLNYFCFVAGLILIMIGISRLIKSAQDGPRGPGGLGTVGTFVVGGILLSGTQILAALSSSFFGIGLGGTSHTYGTLLFTAGMAAAETDAAHNVVSAVIKFMIIVGMISFVRGIFILRDSAEGKGQASVMSGVTHIIGGALAVNLGSVINAIQVSLGIVGFGVAFI